MIEKVLNRQDIYTLESLKLQQMDIATDDTVGLSIYGAFQNSIIALIPTHGEVAMRLNNQSDVLNGSDHGICFDCR